MKVSNLATLFVFHKQHYGCAFAWLVVLVPGCCSGSKGDEAFIT